MSGNGTNKKYSIFILFLIIICISLSFFCIQKVNELKDVNEKIEYQEKILEQYKLIQGISLIDDIYIYGIHLNLSGKLKNEENIKELNIVLFSDKEEKVYPLDYDLSDRIIEYRLSKNINDGINLNDIKVGDYKLFLKITTSSDVKYYSLYNSTDYTNMEYYTITRNNSNNYIEIKSVMFNMEIYVKNINLPDDVYDIVLDPGHGGDDSGAVKGSVYEEKINLEVAMKVKEKLEKSGLKVKLTRDGNYNPGNLSGISAYGKGGRVDIGYETKSKLFISIHSNSTSPSSVRGVEIYTSSKNNKKLASLFAQNIAKTVGISYSNKTQDKISSGVYVRNFTSYELDSYKKSALKDGYTFYESATINTQYYYVIRETGGKITNAYVDGRNKKHEVNVYRNSNIGLDGYLIELGYLTNDKDIKLLINNKDEYSEGISMAIKKYLDIID